MPHCAGSRHTPRNDAPQPGSNVTLSVNAFCPGTTVTFTVNGNVVGTAVADDSGHASLVIVAPAVVGVYVVVATSPPECGLTATSQLSISPVPSTVPLPVTGSDSSFPLQIGLVALAAGVGMVSVATVRRRKPASAA